MSDTIIFAGPSLAQTNVRLCYDYDWRPPAACGDILRAARSGPTAIGLIDGVFEAGPSVWHKEILDALDRGIAVYGAASMGALRAAECAALGMVGVGQVFREYATGSRQSDADVAVVYAPDDLDYLPLTLALVDGEDAVRQMAGLSTSARERLLLAMTSLYFKDRTWDTVFAHAALRVPDEEVARERLKLIGPCLKTRDALLLLDEIAMPGPNPSDRVSPGVTSFLRDLEERLALA